MSLIKKKHPWQKNLYVIWAIQILSLAGFGFGIPFLPFYIQEMGITNPDEVKIWTGLMASLPGLAMGLMAPLWGYLADRFGKKLMLIRATFSGMMIVGAMGLVGTPLALLILRIMQGLFCGTVSAAVTLVASGTPKERAGSALGFLSSSTFIGFSLGPLAGGLAAEYLGYRYSFFIGGGILGAAMILALLFIRELDDGRPADKKRSLISPASSKDKTEKKDNTSLLDHLKPLTPFLAILFCLRVARTMPGSFLPLRIQEMQGGLEGASVTMGYISALTGLVTALAGIILGRLGDGKNKLTLIVVCAAAAFLLEFPTTFSRTILPFSLSYIVLAFAAGGIEPQLQALISTKTNPAKRGLIFGIQTSVGSMGWAFAPLFGSQISIRWNISSIFLGSAFFFITAAALGLVVKKNKK